MRSTLTQASTSFELVPSIDAATLRGPIRELTCLLVRESNIRLRLFTLIVIVVVHAHKSYNTTPRVTISK